MSMKTEYEIEGMSCEHCVSAVKRAIEGVAGVSDVKVEVGKAVVTSNTPLRLDDIANAVAEEGYRVKH